MPQEGTFKTSNGVFFWFNVVYLFMVMTNVTSTYSVLTEIHFQRIWAVLLIITFVLTSKKIIKIDSVGVAIILFSLTLFLSSLSAPSQFISFSIDTTSNYLKLMLFYFVLVSAINSKILFQELIVWFFLFIYIYVIMSLREFYFFGQNVYDMGVKRMIGWDAGTGPNGFAVFVTFALPFAHLLLKSKELIEINIFGRRFLSGKSLYYLAISFFPIAILSIINTQSRTGISALALFFLITAARSKKWIKYLVLSIIILVIAYSFMPQQTRERFLVLYEKDSEISQLDRNKAQWSRNSAEGRIRGLERGMEIFLEYPILGAGPGVYKFVSGTNEETHNLFAQVAAETGVFGLLSFGGIIFISMRNLRKARQLLKNSTSESSFLNMLTTATKNSILLLMFSSLFSHTAYEFMWLWLVGCACLLKSICTKTMVH